MFLDTFVAKLRRNDFWVLLVVAVRPVTDPFKFCHHLMKGALNPS